MPLIQEFNNQKMSPDFIASIKTQSLTQKKDNSNWTSAKAALASGIISSLGLAYFTYKQYGQKDITPLVPLTNPIGTALKVLLPGSMIASVLYYCTKNNNCQKSSSNKNNLPNGFGTDPEPSEINLHQYYQQPQNTTPSSQPQYYYEDLDQPIYTNFSSQNQYPNGPEFPEDYGVQYFKETNLEFPIKLISSSQNQYSSLSDLEKFFYETCKNFKEKKEITKDTIEAINSALENNAVFPNRENMLRELVILAMGLMTVEQDHTLAADLIWKIYKKFLTIDQERAVEIATYCLYMKKSNDESENNDLINKCDEIVKRTKSREYLFTSLAVKCSERADSSLAHEEIVKEFLDKYKEIGEVMVNYMIGCSKLSNSYAQKKIINLFMDLASCLPFLNSCIDNLFVENKLDPLAGNKAVIFNFFDKRYFVYSDWNLLPLCKKIIESYKTTYKISKTEKFIQMLVRASDIVDPEKEEKQHNIDSADAFVLLKIIFQYFKLSKDYENMKMLYKNCNGHLELEMFTIKIQVTLDSFNPNLNQSEQKLLHTK